MLIKCLLVVKQFCCTVCKFEFRNFHIRPTVLALFLDVVFDPALGLEGVALALRTKCGPWPWPWPLES